MQTFEKGGGNLKKKSDFEAKIRGENSVSGGKLHDFELIRPTHPLQPPLPTSLLAQLVQCQICNADFNLEMPSLSPSLATQVS